MTKTKCFEIVETEVMTHSRLDVDDFRNLVIVILSPVTKAQCFEVVETEVADADKLCVSIG